MIRILINFTRLARKIHYPIAKLSLNTKNYHHTTFNYFAKAIKKPEIEFEPTLPSIKDVELDMTKKITNLTKEFSKLRGGRVSVDMFNDIKIDAYGSKIPLSDIGQVSLKASNKLNISIFDPDLISSVSNAIRDCGLGLNPSVEGNSLLVTVPKPSKEARENIVKLANKTSEKARQDIRFIRKEAMDEIKKLEKVIAKDDAHRASKEVEAVTEKNLEIVMKLLKDKEKEILLD